MRVPTANQRRRSARIRNRQQPPAPANQCPPANQRPSLLLQPKTKYDTSWRTADGILVVTSRKRSPPTDEEREQKRQRKIVIKVKQIKVLSLRHEVAALWNFGMHRENLQFGPKNSKVIAQWLQSKYEQYANFETARTFVYRAVKRFQNAAQEPHLDPHRDRRGENRRKTKRNDPRTITLVDELLSEPNVTAPKVGLQLATIHGINISLSTIRRIGHDLSFQWTKPWHTDILTPAQKLKRKLFCAQLLRLPWEALMRRLSGWLFTDEKWWDIVGPAAYKWCKAASKIEAKLQNQVGFFSFLFLHLCIFSCI